IVLVVLSLVFTVTAPAFSDWQNLKNVMLQSSPIVLLAIGQLFAVLVRGVDISVGSTVSLATVTGAMVGQHVSGSLLLVVAAMLATGAAVGTANALVIVKARINNPFIVTLAMLSIVHGLAVILSSGSTVAGIPRSLTTFATGTTLGIPTPFFATAVLCACIAVFLRRMQWGRWMYALGGDPAAASKVGIPRDRVLASCYIVAGLSAGMAALVIAGRFGSGFSDAGVNTELDAVSAVVIGGASFFGGRGGVSSALVGALIIGVMRNGLNISGVDPDWQLIAVGAVLIGALALDMTRERVEQHARAVQGDAAERGDGPREPGDLLVGAAT
ncbi:MAG TPA: ABC transporter permease, partial [Conexibacter sp.]|nr:ABC transporter permease [Conexibacter sp.]